MCALRNCYTQHKKERLTKIMSWTYSPMKWLTEVMVVFFL